MYTVYKLMTEISSGLVILVIFLGGGVIAVLLLHLGESQRNVCLMDSPELTIPPWG